MKKGQKVKAANRLEMLIYFRQFSDKITTEHVDRLANAIDDANRVGAQTCWDAIRYEIWRKDMDVDVKEIQKMERYIRGKIERFLDSEKRRIEYEQAYKEVNGRPPPKYRQTIHSWRIVR